MFNKTTQMQITGSVKMAVEEAIEQSSAQDCIVKILAEPAEIDALERMLSEICDDGTQNGSTLEFWGEDDGREWRIHVSPIPVASDDEDY